jgi:hypothetical protein
MMVSATLRARSGARVRSRRIRSTNLLAVSAAVTTLAIVVEATINREPGTTAADHLTGAAVLPVLLAVGTAAFPRVRPGGQASFALALGLIGATLGGLGALVTIFYVVVPILFAVGITQQPRKSVKTADLGRPYQEVRLRTHDGLTLAGWYVPSQNGAAVLAFPGRRGPVPHARMLVRRGYGVLLIDMRGTGDSHGDPNAFGWGAGADVEAGVDFLSNRLDVRPDAIGGLGLSVGGYLVTGLIVEAITGSTLNRELERRIFTPLRLRHSALQTSPRTAIPDAHGYYVFDKPPASDITGLSPYPRQRHRFERRRRRELLSRAPHRTTTPGHLTARDEDNRFRRQLPRRHQRLPLRARPRAIADALRERLGATAASSPATTSTLSRAATGSGRLSCP